MIRILERGTVYARPDSFFGYAAWPSICRSSDGTLRVVFSGLRSAHIDPFGKVLLCTSHDDGKTWNDPQVIVDTPLDDRDAGILDLGGGEFLVTTFNNHLAWQKQMALQRPDSPASRFYASYCDIIPRVQEDRFYGSLVVLSHDNARTFPEMVKVPVTANHGPIRLRDGTIFYAGRALYAEDADAEHPWKIPIRVYTSRNGKQWDYRSTIPVAPGTEDLLYCEPHSAELADGTIICHIRVQSCDISRQKEVFTIYQCESRDGGKTWSLPHPTGAVGAPPHLLVHSSGALICVYGRRREPFGQRAMISYDGGKTWDLDQILTDDEPDGDLGYPASVELEGGDLFTIFYGKRRAGEADGIYSVRWHLG